MCVLSGMTFRIYFRTCRCTWVEFLLAKHHCIYKSSKMSVWDHKKTTRIMVGHKWQWQPRQMIKTYCIIWTSFFQKHPSATAIIGYHRNVSVIGRVSGCQGSKWQRYRTPRFQQTQLSKCLENVGAFFQVITSMIQWLSTLPPHWQAVKVSIIYWTPGSFCKTVGTKTQSFWGPSIFSGGLIFRVLQAYMSISTQLSHTCFVTSHRDRWCKATSAFRSFTHRHCPAQQDEFQGQGVEGKDQRPKQHRHDNSPEVLGSFCWTSQPEKLGWAEKDIKRLGSNSSRSRFFFALTHTFWPNDSSQNIPNQSTPGCWGDLCSLYCSDSLGPLLAFDVQVVKESSQLAHWQVGISAHLLEKLKTFNIIIIAVSVCDLHHSCVWIFIQVEWRGSNFDKEWDSMMAIPWHLSI